MNSKRMARTLDDLHPAYIRKYTIATLVMRIAVALVGKIAILQPRPSSSTTLRAAPVPRHVKASGPDIAPCGSGFGLIADVVAAVSAISHGPPFTHKPGVQIGTVLMTGRASRVVGDRKGLRVHATRSKVAIAPRGRGGRTRWGREYRASLPQPKRTHGLLSRKLSAVLQCFHENDERLLQTRRTRAYIRIQQ